MAGLAARYRLDFTPTYSSWLNQVERWFRLLSEKALKRDRQFSVREPLDQVLALTDGHKEGSNLFVCAAPAQCICTYC